MRVYRTGSTWAAAVAPARRRAEGPWAHHAKGCLAALFIVILGSGLPAALVIHWLGG